LKSQAKRLTAALIVALLGAGVGAALAWPRIRPIPKPPALDVVSGPSHAQVEMLEKSASATPGDPFVQVQLANAYLALTRAQPAYTPLAKAVRHPATAGAASQLLSQWGTASGDHAAALPLQQTAVAIAPKDPRTWEGLIRTLFALGKIEPANAALAEAIRRFPAAPRLQFIRAEAMADGGSPLQAAQVYERILAKTPDPDAQLMYAVLLARLKSPQRAKVAFQRAVELNPAELTAYLGLAKVNLDLGLTPEAERAAYSALQIAPEDPEAMYVLGQVLLATAGAEQTDMAEALLKRVTTLRPDHMEARYQYGIARLRHRDPKGAIREFETVIAQQPDRLELRQNYARALAAAGDAAAAKEQQKFAGELAELRQKEGLYTSRADGNPKDVGARCDLADFYLQNGAAARAIREFERALTLAPGNARARDGLDKARKAASAE
jgi:tetratricopeptide (TPR) repeat protein